MNRAFYRPFFPAQASYQNPGSQQQNTANPNVDPHAAPSCIQAAMETEGHTYYRASDTSNKDDIILFVYSSWPSLVTGALSAIWLPVDSSCEMWESVVDEDVPRRQGRILKRHRVARVAERREGERESLLPAYETMEVYDWIAPLLASGYVSLSFSFIILEVPMTVVVESTALRRPDFDQ